MTSLNSSVMLLLLALLGQLITFASGVPVHARTPEDDIHCDALPFCYPPYQTFKHPPPLLKPWTVTATPTKGSASVTPVQSLPACFIHDGVHDEICHRSPQPVEEVFPDNLSLLHHSLPTQPRPSTVSMASESTHTQCTTSVFVGKPFVFGPTSTQYAATVTHTSHIACGGCILANINQFGGGPVVIYTTTVTVAETKTVDVAKCSVPGRPPKRVDSSTSIAEASTTNTSKCTTTTFVNVPFQLGPTTTQYAYTTTTTSQLPCGGCALDVFDIGGIGPAVQYTATATVQQTKTEEVLQCSATPISK